MLDVLTLVCVTCRQAGGGLLRQLGVARRVTGRGGVERSAGRQAASLQAQLAPRPRLPSH